MSRMTILSPSEQVAAHLRGELLRGALGLNGEMPGTPHLSAKLEIDRKTIIAALDILEKEGLLETQGAGKSRRIVIPEKGLKAPHLRVGILLYEKEDRSSAHFLNVKYQLQDAGFDVFFASRSLIELKMEVEKVEKFIAKNDADAWVVAAGSRELLTWFAAQPIPAFAMFGRAMGVEIATAGPHKSPATIEALQRLVDMGHRRIVMLTREERRKPMPGLYERRFLAALQSHGIQTGPYNLPDWEDSPAGFHRLLDSLFRHSPPTALIVEAAELFIAAKDHLALQGIVAPKHVSLICTDSDPTFAWCEPAISHIHWDARPITRRIVRWVENVARGKDDRRKTLSKAVFIEGGTIGPVPGQR